MTVERSLRDIRRVREAARGSASAYLLRTRLQRLLLDLERSTASLVPSEQAAVAPLLRLSGLIGDLARVICQPSEAFDERWRAHWHDLREHLDDLEVVLMTALGDDVCAPLSDHGAP